MSRPRDALCTQTPFPAHCYNDSWAAQQAPVEAAAPQQRAPRLRSKPPRETLAGVRPSATSKPASSASLPSPLDACVPCRLRSTPTPASGRAGAAPWRQAAITHACTSSHPAHCRLYRSATTQLCLNLCRPPKQSARIEEEMRAGVLCPHTRRERDQQCQTQHGPVLHTVAVHS